ncbi:MAG: peptidoglycan-binding protein [Candidatus Paceibacterota bacterium]|jgi:hypothetical protein
MNMSKRKLLSLLIGLLFLPNFVLAYVYRDVRISEYMPQPLDGPGWLELRNELSDPVDLAGWSIISVGTTTAVSTTTFPALILPPNGLLVLTIENLPLDGQILYLKDPTLQIIDAAPYGVTLVEGYDNLGIALASGQSAISLAQNRDGGGWDFTGPDRTNQSSRGWFNIVPTENFPTQDSVLAGLPVGVSVNLSTSTDWTSLGELTLSRDGFDPVVWRGTHNLSVFAEREELLRLATELANRVITPVIPPAPSGGGGGGGGGGSYSPPVLPSIDPATTTGLVLGTSTFRFNRFLRQGMRGADVQELQKILKTAGFFKVQTTNYFGPATKKSLILWQKKNKIRPATGVVGRPTLNYLNKSTF